MLCVRGAQPKDSVLNSTFSFPIHNIKLHPQFIYHIIYHTNSGQLVLEGFIFGPAEVTWGTGTITVISP